MRGWLRAVAATKPLASLKPPIYVLLVKIEQMKTAEYITEDMKATDQMAWVRAMNSIRNRAEEIVLHELIYGESVV